MAVLAYDLGASGGRALLGRLTDNRILVEEFHRFPNDPVAVNGRLYWDILRLFHEMKQALLKTKLEGVHIESLGIDSWAVDFGLIGSNGELLGNPYHYRDEHTNGRMRVLFDKVPRAEIFARTGIQFLQFNTIYQLYALQSDGNPILNQARQFLMIPDLLRYFLTGEMMNEFTNATTTQLYNPLLDDWDPKLLDGIGVSRSLFGKVVKPGAEAGSLRSDIVSEIGLGSAIPVTAVAEHDTGSAVVAVPAANRHFAYLSSGTWSLMGTEVERPVINELAQELNFTNEGGAYGTFRLLKNIMGLWLVQECRRQWEREGKPYSFPELIRLAEAAPKFAAFIDPDHESFLAPGDMPERVRQYCLATGQKPLEEPGAVIRCVLESLVLKYRVILEQTERLVGKRFDGLHMVGGGIQNTLLCQWTANAIGRPVWAGPVEGSGIGNLVVQWIAQGKFTDIWEARKVIRDSFPVDTYEPVSAQEWEEMYGRFVRLVK